MRQIMNSRISNIIYIALLLLAGAFSSCSKEEPDTNAAKEEVPVIIHIVDNAISRSYVNNDGTIKLFRIIVFAKQKDGSWVYEKQVVFHDFSPTAESPCTIMLTEGEKKFYFFANDDKADLYSYSTGLPFAFEDDRGYTENQLMDIAISQFSYSNAKYDISDLLPMTGFVTYTVTRSTSQSTSVVMTRAVAKVKIFVKLNAALPAGQSLKVVLASIANNPTMEYFYPRNNSDGQVQLPSYDADNYAHRATNKLETPITITTTSQLVMQGYLHENPYGTGGYLSGTKLADHLIGYSGESSRIDLIYNYNNGTDNFEKGVLSDIPYLERNNELDLSVTITPPSSATESFDINVKVIANWTDKYEEVPTYQ